MKDTYTSINIIKSNLTMDNQEIIWDNVYRESKGKWKMEKENLPKIFTNKSVLELGVGNGKAVRSILSQNPSLITAIDFSLESVNLAKSIFNGKNNVKIMKADVKNLPFKAENFDIVICHYILNNLLHDERQQAVNEIFRVLKNKGKVVFEDFAQGDFRETEKSNEILESHTLKNKSGIICHFFDVKEVESLFNGFSLINLKNKISTPIHNKPQLKRAIITGIIQK